MCCDTFTRGWNKNGQHIFLTIPRASDHLKSISLNKRPCQPGTAGVDTNSNELFYYHLLSVLTNVWNGNTIDDPYAWLFQIKWKTWMY